MSFRTWPALVIALSAGCTEDVPAPPPEPATPTCVEERYDAGALNGRTEITTRTDDNGRIVEVHRRWFQARTGNTTEQTAFYAYDATGRVVAEDIDDRGGYRLHWGERDVTITDDLGVITSSSPVYSLDARGSVTYALPGGTQFGDGYFVAYAYDTDGRLLSMHSVVPPFEQANVIERHTTWTYGSDGFPMTRTSDTNYSDPVVTTFRTTATAAALVIEADVDARTSTYVYRYDEAGRLTEIVVDDVVTRTLAWTGDALEITDAQGRRYTFSEGCDAPRRFVRPRLPHPDAIPHAPLLERTWENPLLSPFL